MHRPDLGSAYARHMKGLLFVFAFLACGVALFVGVLMWAAGNGADKYSAMTREARTVVVTTSTFERNRKYSKSRGYRVIYEYSVGGQAYKGDEWVPQLTWSLDEAVPLRVCHDPEAPAQHVIVQARGRECDGGSLGGADVQRAEPVTPATPGA